MCLHYLGEKRKEIGKKGTDRGEKGREVRKRRKGREKRFLVWIALSKPDLDEIDKIFEEYDAVMAKNVFPRNLFPILNATAILWRLQVSREKRRLLKLYSMCSLLLLLGAWYWHWWNQMAESGWCCLTSDRETDSDMVITANRQTDR